MEYLTMAATAAGMPVLGALGATVLVLVFFLLRGLLRHVLALVQLLRLMVLAKGRKQWHPAKALDWWRMMRIGAQRRRPVFLRVHYPTQDVMIPYKLLKRLQWNYKGFGLHGTNLFPPLGHVPANRKARRARKATPLAKAKAKARKRMDAALGAATSAGSPVAAKA